MNVHQDTQHHREPTRRLKGEKDALPTPNRYRCAAAFYEDGKFTIESTNEAGEYRRFTFDGRPVPDLFPYYRFAHDRGCRRRAS